MKVLIRFIRRLESGAVEHHDRTFDGERLTLGRGTGQDIHLRDRRVALEHAEIRKVGTGYEISTRGVSGITVNDSFCRKASLKLGDSVYIGSNILKIIQPPESHDFAFTFELDPEAREEEAERAPVRDELIDQAPSKRTWSWGLALAVLAVFLLVPLLVFQGGSIADFLRGTPLPDDKVWLSGPLHPTHQLEIGDDCTACHEKPFAQVRDSACLACHAQLTHHVPKDARKHEDMESWRCQSCHKEHNEPAQLVLAENKLCADCHVGILSTDAVAGGLLPVGNFKDQHPEFRVSLLVAAGQPPVSWQVERIALDDASLAEKSGLSFPHDEHLSADGVTGPDGPQVLACADCHQLEQGGEFFQPIRMADHCQSCHVLEFDEQAPGREVPHARPEAVQTMLQDYFASKLLTGRLASGELASTLRIPGQRELTAKERAETLAESRRLAGERFDELFEGVCAECHASEALSTTPGAMPQIKPVRLTGHWMPKAHFSHARHEAGLECGDCHAAKTSSQSSDVLMPKIDGCRDCHGRNLASTCLTCHGFHLQGAGLMYENLLEK